jgi:hypothetical protein
LSPPLGSFGEHEDELDEEEQKALSGVARALGRFAHADVDGPEAPVAFRGSLLDGLTVDAVEAEVMRSRLTWPREHATPRTLAESLKRKFARFVLICDDGDDDATEHLAIEIAAMALRIAEEGRKR